MVLWMRALT